MKYCLLLASAIFLAAAGPLFAEQVRYSGHIAVNSEPFTGNGSFRFAIVDAHGTAVWATGQPDADSGMPTDIITLPVNDGAYHVVLGDSRFGMTPLDPKILPALAELKLRVWFDDGTHGVALVADGVPLAPGQPEPPPVGALSQAPENTAITGDVNEADLATIAAELRRLEERVNQMAARSNAVNQQILAELRQIRSQPAKQPAQPPRKKPTHAKLPLRDKDAHALGSPDAPVMIMEFTDYQCPFCKKFFQQTFPELKAKYIDTGKVRFVSRNLPLGFHKNAANAATAALCAGEQGKYWEMRETLFTNNTALASKDLAGYANDLKLDTKQFEQCQNEKARAAIISRDKTDANSVGITGTPTFVIGRVSEGVLDGDILVGAAPLSMFAAAIDKVLNQTDAETAEDTVPNE